MVALLLVVYVGYTIYVVRVLFIIAISIDYNQGNAAISTYIIGNRLSYPEWDKVIMLGIIIGLDYIGAVITASATETTASVVIGIGI